MAGISMMTKNDPVIWDYDHCSSADFCIDIDSCSSASILAVITSTKQSLPQAVCPRYRHVSSTLYIKCHWNHC